ncbi:Gfo/Idh/MocA family oxidoreductase [Flavobacteriaceae bacterium R33]|uniref:Gfo/Idh/MocA family oxidoreductase n=2 Tax=Poritiphilus flavus TaxID=2697053 RepID=A0A6L9EAG9_9FLAO|nr:Gfo/Idh/MocA family oxidoreductase [Poritiphilus flavus]
MDKKIKWGIIGLGRIAKLFAEDLKLIKDAELVAVASTDMERAKSFARDFGNPKAYASYRELFKDAEVDVVYIATLHHTHCPLSVEAMKHKKHVLCEKPIAINKSEARQMVEASERNKVFFMEAFWSRFNPSIVKIKELVSKGEIGKLRYISAEFTFYKLDEDPQSRLLNVDLAGGSLMDMGVYPVFLSYLLLGKPKEILARSQFLKSGTEIQTSMIFQYENAQSVLYSGFANNTDMKAKVCGEEGEIFIRSIWHETQGFQIVRNGTSQIYELPTKGKGFAHEIEEVHKCIRSKKLESAEWSHQNSLDLIGIVDEIRLISGIKYPFEV